MTAPHRLAQLLTLMQDGTLKMPATKEFAFDQVAEAWQESAAGHVRGKLAIRVAPVARSENGVGATEAVAPAPG